MRPGRRSQARPVGTGTAKFDLTLFVDDALADVHAAIEYDTQLFDADRIERLAEHLTTLLEGIVESIDRAIEDLPLLAATEMRALTSDLNADTKARPPARLHDAFERTARRTPRAVAVEFGDRRLTYAELDRWADQLASELRRRGAGADSIVAVSCERSVELIVAILGVLKAGAAYTPVDLDHPAERQERQLRLAGARLMLTTQASRHRSPRMAHLKTLVVEPMAGRKRASKLPPVDPASLAYVIYTSGSTGEPKGVMNQHDAVTNRLAWMVETQDLGPDDVVLHKTPISFDVSVWEILWPLSVGARLVVAEPDAHRDPAAVARTVAASGVTVAHFVPSMLRVFIDQPALESGSLARIYCSGEALSPSLAHDVLVGLPVALHNLYGPTEAAIEVTHWRVPRNREVDSVPIGRPITNARVYVLDRSGRPAPVGIPGELHIGGAPVARGYLGRPDITADRFVPDPLGEPGARMYRTGDLARITADGQVEFLGRADDQVKLRGIRIELGEVASALRAHDAVRDAVAVARQLSEYDLRLVAYVVPVDGAAVVDPLVRSLREQLRSTLPEAMIPDEFVVLAELPVTSTGKLDVRALPEPETAPRIDRVEPRTETERRVALIWSEVLRHATADVRDRFFEIGGNSLLATQVATRVNQAFDVDIPLRSLFEHQTLGGYAGVVARAASARTGADPSERRARPDPGPRPSAAALLLELDELSDEAVTALLSELSASEGHVS